MKWVARTVGTFSEVRSKAACSPERRRSSSIQIPMASLSFRHLEVLSEIGRGSAGSVLAARMKVPAAGLSANEHVAIKRYSSWVLEQNGEGERLSREYYEGKRLHHPNIIRIHGLVFEAGSPVLVMELCDGSLDNAIATLASDRSYFSTTQSLGIIADIADGLAFLHSRGVVHRDIKNANILLKNGRAIIGDLGVIGAESIPHLTTAGRFLGTIAYASPHYLATGNATATDDQYSLGAVALELLSGLPLFHGKNWTQIIQSKAAPFVADWSHIEAVKRRHGRIVAALAQWLSLTVLRERRVDLSLLCRVCRLLANVFAVPGCHGLQDAVDAILLLNPQRTARTGFISVEEAARAVTSEMLYVLEPLLLEGGIDTPTWEEHPRVRRESSFRSAVTDRELQVGVPLSDLERAGAIYRDRSLAPDGASGGSFRVDGLLQLAYWLELA